MIEWNWCDCSCDSAQHVAGRKCWETPIRMIWWMEVSIISFGWSWCGEAKKTKPPRGGWMYQRRALWLCQRTLHWGQQRTLGINANYIWLHPLWLHPFQIVHLYPVHCAMCIWLLSWCKHPMYSKLWFLYSIPLLNITWLQLFKCHNQAQFSHNTIMGWALNSIVACDTNWFRLCIMIINFCHINLTIAS